MPKRIDISEKKFGHLLVVGNGPEKVDGKKGDDYWKCLCDCGNFVYRSSSDLRHDITYSCGCIKYPPKSEHRRRSKEVLDLESKNLRRCGACKHIKSLETDFSKSKTALHGLRYVCKSCEIKYKKSRLEGMTKRERYFESKAHSLKADYNISLEEFDWMVALQQGKCLICTKLLNTNPDKGKLPSVDHDHSCCKGSESCGNCIRGILCNKCNTGLGLFDDKVINLERSITYLTSYNRSASSSSTN